MFGTLTPKVDQWPVVLFSLSTVVAKTSDKFLKNITEFVCLSHQYQAVQVE